MAGRFLFQKIASRLSRSTSLLGTHASAPVTLRASEGGVRTLSNSSYYEPVLHTSTGVPNYPDIHGYGGGTRALCNIFNRASTQPSMPLPSIRRIHGSPNGYLSTLQCNRAASFRSSLPKSLPPVIAGRMKQPFVDYVKAKQKFSSKISSASGTTSWEHKLLTREAEWQAKREAAIAASKAECAAWDAEWKAHDAAFHRFVMTILGSWCLIGIAFYSTLDSEPSQGGTSSCKGQQSNSAQVAATSESGCSKS